MPTARERMTAVLADLARGGARRVAVYGAGRHTELLADVLAGSPVPVVAVIDDDPARAGGRCAGIEVIPPQRAAAAGVEAVVISSDAHEEAIWSRRGRLVDAGITVRRLYDRPPTTHYEQGWDHYARHWRPDRRLAWDARGQGWVPAADQSGIVHPGDEWAEADRIVARLIRPMLSPDAVVLEIGPGSGRITQRVLPHCRELHAVEISSEMIAALHRRLGNPPGLHVVKVQDADLSMFGDDSFDAAYSIGVFVHLQMEDIFRYLRELRRVLKPGASFVIETVCDPDEPRHWHNFLKRIADIDAGRRDDPCRFHFISASVLRKFCDHLGWRLETGEGIRFCSLKPPAR